MDIIINGLVIETIEVKENWIAEKYLNMKEESDE